MIATSSIDLAAHSSGNEPGVPVQCFPSSPELYLAGVACFSLPYSETNALVTMRRLANQRRRTGYEMQVVVQPSRK
jgi:hypothetical protein